MKIHEYQAKAIFAAAGIPVPRGKVVTTPAQAKEVATELKGKVVLKAQVYAGGRGKAGGIKVAESPAEAESLAKQMIGMKLVTHQTGPQGVPVSKLLVEEAAPIGRELYLGLVVDNSVGLPVMMASEAGGMDIEEVATKTPEKIYKVYIDQVTGFQANQGRRLAYNLSLEPALVRPAADMMASLFDIFQAKDCSLVEINPLVVTADKRLLAVDAKINFDDNALFRHKDVVEMRDPEQEDPLETEAARFGISYIKLDGDVGCLVNGAGLAMATMDIIKLKGAMPANFLDVGGGATEEMVATAFKIILSDPKVKRVLVNIFGGILRCDTAARGIIMAVKEKEVKVPVVMRMRGTNLKEAERLLAESGMKIIVAKDLTEAAEKVVAAGAR